MGAVRLKMHSTFSIRLISRIFQPQKVHFSSQMCTILYIFGSKRGLHPPLSGGVGHALACPTQSDFGSARDFDRNLEAVTGSLPLRICAGGISNMKYHPNPTIELIT